MEEEHIAAAVGDSLAEGAASTEAVVIGAVTEAVAEDMHPTRTVVGSLAKWRASAELVIDCTRHPKGDRLRVSPPDGPHSRDVKV